MKKTVILIIALLTLGACQTTTIERYHYRPAKTPVKENIIEKFGRENKKCEEDNGIWNYNEDGNCVPFHPKIITQKDPA